MLKVLINSYTCCPGMGSEQGMGWNFISGLAKAGCEVFVVTESEYASKVMGTLEKEKGGPTPALPHREGTSGSNNAEVPESWAERIHFHFVPAGETEEESRKIRLMCWNQGTWSFYPKYAKWQEKALTVAKDIIKMLEDRGGCIDVMHQLNMAGFREPGMLYKINEEREREGKKRIPLVWGPMTGYGGIPFKFMTPGGLKFTAFYLLKNTLNTLQLLFHHRVRKMMKASDCLIATSPEMKHGIEKFYGREVERMNETGTTQSLIASEERKEKREKLVGENILRLIWVGRFMYTKQLPLALKTMKRLKECGYGAEDIELHIVGKGFTESETEAMHVLAKDLEVDEMCRWHGFIPNEEVQQLMRECDLFFFTSIFEGTSTVMLEAIQNGLPVLCFDICGFGPVVDEKIGRKIACESPKQAVQEFTDAIVSFRKNRLLLNTMSENCAAKAEEMSWDRKIGRLMEIYERVNG